MLYNILVIIILFSIVLCFFVVKIWKKRNYVKEIYIDEGVSIIFYVMAIISTITLLIIYFMDSKELTHIYKLLLIILLMDFVLLFAFCFTATFCIYLKDGLLIQKSIINSKKILLNNDTKIIEKFDRTIIKSKRKSISINIRYLIGNTNNLINNVKLIINK